MTHRPWPALLALALLLSACTSRSPGAAPAGGVRELKDPRTVPTAPAPSVIPSPIPALDAGRCNCAPRPCRTCTW
ncbi:MAG: hypothetical protein U0531_00925 [Dehalococcoidia bacterium]